MPFSKCIRIWMVLAVGMTALGCVHAQFILRPDTLSKGKFTGGHLILELSDGKWMKAGISRYDHISAEFHRYTADGQPDLSFGNKGIVLSRIADDRGYISLEWMKEDANGKMVMGTFEKDTGRSASAVYRFLPDGTPDISFGTEGKLTIHCPDEHCLISDGSIQPDGKIVLAGSTPGDGLMLSSEIFLMRILPDGSPDPYFGTKGRTHYDCIWYMVSGDRLLLQPDGKIVVAGWAFRKFMEGYHITRFLPNGQPDIRFGQEDACYVDLLGTGFTFQSFFIQPDGKIVFLGTGTSELYLNQLHYITTMGRLSKSGGKDPDYAPLSIFPCHKWGDDAIPGAVAAPLPDGSVLFAYLEGGSPDALHFRIEKFFPDGRKDPLFHPFGTINNTFTIIPETRQTDSDLIIVNFHKSSGLLMEVPWRDKTILIKW